MRKKWPRRWKRLHVPKETQNCNRKLANYVAQTWHREQFAWYVVGMRFVAVAVTGRFDTSRSARSARRTSTACLERRRHQTHNQLVYLHRNLMRPASAYTYLYRQHGHKHLPAVSLTRQRTCWWCRMEIHRDWKIARIRAPQARRTTARSFKWATVTAVRCQKSLLTSTHATANLQPRLRNQMALMANGASIMQWQGRTRAK